MRTVSTQTIKFCILSIGCESSNKNASGQPNSAMNAKINLGMSTSFHLRFLAANAREGNKRTRAKTASKSSLSQ